MIEHPPEPASPVLGIHHVTAIAGDPQRNIDFYAGVLGLRLVKRTVNFDDPQTYHFYFGDEVGTPGTIMTFFPWPGARRGQHGTGQVAITSFAVLPGAIGFWVERLLRHGVAYEGPARRGTGDDAETVLAFRDPDGLMLSIVGHEGAEARRSWEHAPGIAPEHAIRGFHSVTLWVDRRDETERVLTSTLGFIPVRDDETTRRYAIGDGGPATIVDVRATGGFVRGVGGAGTVHHVAWNVPDDAAQRSLRADVLAAGLHATDVIDRTYFRSVYFREPGGVLYELATQGPGFTIDEPVSHLGEQLQLPPQYEPHRDEIESVLPPIHLPVPPAAERLFAQPGGPEDVSGEALGHVHRYVPPTAEGERAGSTTLLLLHGTGGDENDLLPLGRALLPGAGMLSPRGNVMENGAPRFFRRIREGVFDQEDLARRTADLAQFVESAIRTYSLEHDGIVAVGFSNGANIASSLLLRRPGLLRGAVLLSPMVPFEPDELPDLSTTCVFIGAGRRDPIAPPEQVERLATMLRSAGADVTVHWDRGGHAVTPEEVAAAHDWILRCLTRPDARPERRTSEDVFAEGRG
jgi:predicted esterase/catechol 2,3-dioxygenase-like lactoylglutathione lyase family enzyme